MMIDKSRRRASLIDGAEEGNSGRLQPDAGKSCTRCEYYYNSEPSPRIGLPAMKHASTLYLALVLVLISGCSAADIKRYFTRSPQSIVAPPGDRVTFQCETNVAAYQVKWKMNEKFLHPGNDSDIRISGNYLSVKLSKNRERYMQQVGDYQCVVDWGAEALTSIPAQLSIAKLDGFKVQENRTLTLVEGNSAVIFCDPPYSNPPPIIQFYKDNVPLETETGNPMLTDSGVLYLENVTVASSGTYWCSVTNHITTDTIPSPWSTRLVVQRQNTASRKGPEFLLKPKSYEIVPKDGNMTLECIAVGNPPPTTSFRKLRSSSLNNVQSSNGNLHIINAGPAHEGEYICEAHNGIGSSITALTAVVLNSMPVITKGPENVLVGEGESAMLDCATEGLPKPRVYWVFNGHSVNDDGNIQITEYGLKISKVEKKHAGLFQCFATNPMGTVTSPAEFKVLPKMIPAMASDSSAVLSSVGQSTPPPARHHHRENHHHKKKYGKNGRHGKKGRKHKGQDMIPPSKPTMNRLSDESVMVRWSVPENSGYPIQFFKVQYKEVNKRNGRWMTLDDDIPPHIHSYEVRDLKVGHAYKFRIAAVYSNNDNKVGPVSDKFVLQKEISMRRPVFVPSVTTAAPHNSTAIKLQWKYMRGEGGGVDGYFIYYREATTVNDYAKVAVMGSETEIYYIAHLKPGTAYDMKIQAFNKAGASNFSSIITAKTLGIAATESPEEGGKRQPTDIIIPEEEPVASNERLYLLLGCLFAGFWIILCVACALCYKCKQKRAEDDAKYPCDIPVSIEAKTMNTGNGSVLHNHGMNGYLHGISSHMDEKETSFMERHHNNNRPISPSQITATTIEDLATFKSAVSLSLERQTHTVNQFVPNGNATATTIISATAAVLKETSHNEIHNNSLVRNNSLQRKKHRDNIQNSNSLRRGPYISCSNDELDAEPIDSKGGKIFPKEHYKASRKHNRKRSSFVET